MQRGVSQQEGWRKNGRSAWHTRFAARPWEFHSIFALAEAQEAFSLAWEQLAGRRWRLVL